MQRSYPVHLVDAARRTRLSGLTVFEAAQTF
jgi:hypothetical protein